MTASFIGFVNGDGPSSLTRQATVTTTATSASGPGAYPIIASGALSPDYSINYVSGILVVTASPATPHPDPGRVAFLTTVYGEVLGRAAEPSGLRYWRRRFAAGATPGEVVREFFGSPERRSLRRLHQAPAIDRHTALADGLRAAKQGRNRVTNR